MKNKYINSLKSSPFKQMKSSPMSVRLKGYYNEIAMWCDYEGKDNINSSSDLDIDKYLPPYQRGGDKWTKEMKSKFIENLLKGVSTNIVLVKVKGDNDNYQILDGQQRLKAIKDFLEGRIKLFNDTLSWSDIQKEFSSITFGIYLIDVDTEIEACQFYIDMNENITHSKEDIEIAYRYLEKIS